MLSDMGLHMRFLKFMRRYGSFRYELSETDYIFCVSIKPKNKCHISVDINGKKYEESYDSLEDCWPQVKNMIDKYKYDNGYIE